MSGTRPFLPAEGILPRLPLNAPAPAQLARLLDALLILDAEGSSRIGNLAARVGLDPDRLRDLLSAYMVAGADAPNAAFVPFSVVFGASDVVRVDDARGGEPVSLLADVGRRAVTVDEVVEGLVAIRQLLHSGSADERHRAALEDLATVLTAALRTSVERDTTVFEDRLSQAVVRRQRVEVRYRDPWTGALSTVRLAPFDVYYQRDRLVLDAGGDFSDLYRTFEARGIESLVPVGSEGGYDVPPLPARDRRQAVVRAVIRTPAGPGAADRLLDSWGGVVVARSGRGDEGTVDIEVEVDQPAGERVGVLLLQLGLECSLVGPEHLRPACREVAARVLAAHGGARGGAQR